MLIEAGMHPNVCIIALQDASKNIPFLMLIDMWNPALACIFPLKHFVYVYRSDEGQFPCLHFFRWKIQ